MTSEQRQVLNKKNSCSMNILHDERLCLGQENLKSNPEVDSPNSSKSNTTNSEEDGHELVIEKDG